MKVFKTKRFKKSTRQLEFIEYLKSISVKNKIPSEVSYLERLKYFEDFRVIELKQGVDFTFIDDGQMGWDTADTLLDITLKYPETEKRITLLIGRRDNRIYKLDQCTLLPIKQPSKSVFLKTLTELTKTIK